MTYAELEKLKEEYRILGMAKSELCRLRKEIGALFESMEMELYL
jgi:hypothetical protein